MSTTDASTGLSKPRFAILVFFGVAQKQFRGFIKPASGEGQ